MVEITYRRIYNCSLESELDLGWGEGALAYTAQDGGKRWRVENGVWVQKIYENQVAAVAITEDINHRFVTDAEKAAWNSGSSSGLTQQQIEGII